MPSIRPGHASSLALAALLTAVTLAWLNAFGGSFQFDDWRVIVDNSAVHSWDGWLGSMPGIRPLLKLAYVGNWLLDTTPFGFHAFNLLCHLGNTTLVFFLCRRLLNSMNSDGQCMSVALLAALLFGLHPAQTEVVTYVSGRSVGLMSLFYLGAVAAHSGFGDRRGRWLSLVLFAAAMAVKETAWTLPFALILWEVAHGATLKESLRRVLPHLLMLMLLLAIVLLLDRYRQLLAVSLATRTPGENLLVQVHGLWYLITGPLFALRTNSDPVIPTEWPWYMTAAKALLLTGLIVTGFRQLRRRPWIGFGLLWFFLHLLPTNSLLARLDVANDRQLYLPLIGPALIAAVAVHRWLPQRAIATTVLLLALGLGSATVLRNGDYRDEISFWQAAVRSSPGTARAWNNLGYACQKAGRRADARDAYAQALAVDPGYWRARVNLMVLDGEGE